MPKPQLIQREHVIDIMRYVRGKQQERTVNAYPLTTLVLSPAGYITQANRKAEASFGVPAESLVGKHISALVEEQPTDHESYLSHVLGVAKRLGKVESKAAAEGEALKMTPGLVWKKVLGGKGGRDESLMRASVVRTPQGPRVIASIENTGRVFEKSMILKDLFDITNQINNSSTDLDLTLHEIAKTFEKRFNAVAIVARPNGEPDTLKLKGFAGEGIPPAEFIESFGRIRYGEGLLGRTAVSQQMTEEENIQKMKGSVAAHLDQKYDFRHSIAIPLTAKGADGKPVVLGVIGLYKRGPEKFKDWEKTVLQMLSKNTTTVIKNAQLTKEITRQAERVSLTGLYNRGYLLNAIRNYVSPREAGEKFAPTAEGKKMGVIYLDANNLKLLNDTHGHNQGDRGLKAIAGVLKEVAGEDNVVSQPGGDEFAIFMPDATKEQTAEAAQKIKVAIKRIAEKDRVFSGVNFGATIGAHYFEAGAKDTDTTHDLNAIQGKHAHDEELYVDAILGPAEARMRSLKELSKRATGFLPRAALEDFARSVVKGHVTQAEEKKLLGILTPHLQSEGLKAYYRLKQRMKREA